MCLWNSSLATRSTKKREGWSKFSGLLQDGFKWLEDFSSSKFILELWYEWIVHLSFFATYEWGFVPNYG